MVDRQELVEQKRRVALLKRKVELQQRFGLLFYKPHPKQDAFHRAAEKFNKRIIRAGNRFGKSTAGTAEDCAFMLGERPWYAKGDPARTCGIPKYPTKGLVVAQDWDKVDEVFTGEPGKSAPGTEGKLWKFLPKDFVTKTKKNSAGVIAQVWGANGAQIQFETVSSFKTNAMSAESGSYDWIHYDEPLPEAMRKALARGGMDRGLHEWFTLTSLSEFWINDFFFPRVGLRDKFVLDEHGAYVRINDPHLRTWGIEANTYENVALSRENIAEYEATLTPDERVARIQGKPLNLSGLVYKEFDPTRHVLTEIPHGWADFNTPPDDYVLYISIDPHPQTPHAVLFTWVSPQGYMFIADELFIQTTIPELTEVILHKAARYEYPPVKCDPIAWIRDPITGTCMAEEFMINGLVVDKASKALSFGILKMREVFRQNNPQKLFIAPNLHNFLREISSYTYDKENKPRDKDDHLMECMYRTFINDPIWYPRQLSERPIREMEIVSADMSLY